MVAVYMFFMLQFLQVWKNVLPIYDPGLLLKLHLVNAIVGQWLASSSGQI